MKLIIIINIKKIKIKMIKFITFKKNNLEKFKVIFYNNSIIIPSAKYIK